MAQLLAATPPPVTYSQHEVDRAVESAVERTRQRDRVCGFLGIVAALPSTIPPGASGVLSVGFDAARAVAKELRTRGFLT